MFYVSIEGHVHELYYNSVSSWRWKHTILTLNQQRKFLVRVDRESLTAVPLALALPAAAASSGSGQATPSCGTVPLSTQLLEFDGTDAYSLRYTTAADKRCRMYRRGLGGLFGWKFSVM